MLKNLVVGTLGVSVGAALSAIDSHSLVSWPFDAKGNST